LSGRPRQGTYDRNDRILRELNRSGKRDVPPGAPMPFKKQWRKLVIGADGKINRRLYETVKGSTAESPAPPATNE